MYDQPNIKKIEYILYCHKGDYFDLVEPDVPKHSKCEHSK
jgi:hypothetical protein